MKSYIDFSELSAKEIRRFVSEIIEMDPEFSVVDPLFLLGKAAAYTDVAAALEIIKMPEAASLLSDILGYALEIEFS